MFTVIHVFVEDEDEDRRGHMVEWFGNMPDTDMPDDAACLCGARMIPLNKQGSVVGLYHCRHWPMWDRYES